MSNVWHHPMSLQQQRLQVCQNKNIKSNEGRQEKNGGVKGRDGSADELERETGEEQITVGWTIGVRDGGAAAPNSGSLST